MGLDPLQKTTNVSRWLQRFEAMMEWEGVEAGKKKHALLAFLGQDAFDLLADATVPARPADKTYDELVQLIKQQLQPAKLPIAARYEFYQQRQGNDDVATYLRKLRAAAGECAFGQQLEDRLRRSVSFWPDQQRCCKKDADREAGEPHLGESHRYRDCP